MNGTQSFRACFEALTGYKPLRWQARLFKRMLAGTIPPACDLPTGLGKTSVIPIWLIALTSQNGNPVSRPLPRRLIYIVNRRTIVDQATDVVEKMRERLGNPNVGDWAKRHGQTLSTLGKGFRALSACALDGEPFAVSTLRGELADNEQWKIDPSSPAIIIGTIDMIGSKLLFSGYGDGRYGRTHHAGLIGQDVLIVHDEAHLSPAFDELLRAVEREQKAAHIRSSEAEPRAIGVMRLTATSRRSRVDVAGAGDKLVIEDEDLRDEIVRQRMNAKKRLRFVEVDGSGKKGRDLADRIAKEAVKHDPERCRVLVYVRLPETAESVRAAITDKLGLKKAAQAETDSRLRLLTGTIRGFERDRLADCELFKAFKSDPNRQTQLDHTAYLISTSAGEVGADWDADHLVCDLTTLDSMAQRFGRVNRLGVDKNGKPRQASITVVVEKSKEPKKTTNEEKTTNDNEANHKKPTKHMLESAITKTGDILRTIEAKDGDVSPAALSEVLEKEEAEAAFSPSPTILPATDILFDHWSLTSIKGRLPGRPEVGPYLHGVAQWDPPETYVAWRAEISDLARAGVSNDDLEEIFDVFPLRSAERLRDRSDRVLVELQARAERLQKDPHLHEVDRNPKLILLRWNSIEWAALSDLAPVEKNDRDAAIARLAFATVVLPVQVGGLRDGLLNGSAPPLENPKTLDVAEITATGQRVRQRVQVFDQEPEQSLVGAQVVGGLAKRLRLTLRDEDDGGRDGAGSIALEYRVAKGERGEPGQNVDLAPHNVAVGQEARRIATTLGLSQQIVGALRLAGNNHDLGKHRWVWQSYACNRNGSNPVAKSKKYLHWQALGGYRHEFGSLLEAAALDEIALHSERDLILHLIAAHHGHARPHFERRAFDSTYPLTANETATAETMQRFARLHQRFGRWGLAWLESLLRCADAAASKMAVSSAPTTSPTDGIVGVR